MPSGVYPEFKRGGKIKHPAAGLSKNKYNAKGELIQRKSRSKLAKKATETFGQDISNQKELAGAIGKHLLPKLADVGIGNQTAYVGSALPHNPLQQEYNAKVAPKMGAMKTLAPGISKDVDMSIIPDWAKQQGRRPKLSSATVSDDDAYSDSSTTPSNNRLVNTIDHPDIANAIFKAAYDPRVIQASSRKLGKRTDGFGSKNRPQDYGEVGEFLTKTGQVRKRAKGAGRKKSPVEQAIGMTIEDVDTTEQEPESVLESQAIGQVIQNQPNIDPPKADNTKPEIEPEYDMAEPIQMEAPVSREESMESEFDFEGAINDLDRTPSPEADVETFEDDDEDLLINSISDESQLKMMEKVESMGVSDIDFPPSEFDGIDILDDMDDIEWAAIDDDQPEIMQSVLPYRTTRGPATIIIFVAPDTDDAEVIGFGYVGIGHLDANYIMKAGYGFDDDDD